MLAAFCFGIRADHVQESFYAKLKKFADEGNTNLYVSNIPRNMNEHVSWLPAGGHSRSHRLISDRNSRNASSRTRFCPLGFFVTTAAMAEASVLLGMTQDASHFLMMHFLTCNRFESRDVCKEVMKDFNNTPINKNGGEEHVIQIRYSDTHEQKMLKQQTAAARQFRAAEFEYGCLQTGRHGPRLLSMPERLSSSSPGHTANPSVSDTGATFEQYLELSAA